ncbi:MAG: hypothetical protein V3V13_00705 [Paracoccaceae bacterium]
MKILATLAGMSLLFLSSPALSQENDASQAVQDWLNGNEIESVQALSRAANTGDTDAQLLLGQIDRDTVAGGFSDYILGLSKAQRRELLRAPNDKGSINWLLALTDPELEDLGAAIFSYKIGREPIWNALSLQSTGEISAAEFVLWSTVNIGRFDLVNAMPSDSYGLSDAGFLKWVTTYVSGENKALTMNRFTKDTDPNKVMGLLAIKRLARVLSLNQYFSDEVDEFIMVIRGQGFDLPENVNLVSLNANMIKIAEVDGPLSIVSRFCAKCSEDKVDYDCMVQAMEITNGYETLLALRTPVENVISAEDYIHSERPVAIFAQLLKGRADYYSRPIRSSCIAAHIGAGQ